MQQNNPYQKEFKEFIDVAAHDLDAPLRKLGVWVERLTSKYEGADKEEIKDYVQRINGSLVAMRSMIDDLACLSKVSAAQLQIVSCDLGSIVKAVVVELKSRVESKQAVIEYKDLPTIPGDSGQYRQLFRILLENALLFTKDDTAPHITINARTTTETEKKEHDLSVHKNYVRIEISDNGIGISPDHAGKIFRPFVRLHAKSAFPGNGIGLAIAKRILINHGGVIYAQSTEHAGARFIFILPETIDQNAEIP